MGGPGLDNSVTRTTMTKDGYCNVDADLPQAVPHGSPIHLSLVVWAPASPDTQPIVVSCEWMAGFGTETYCEDIVP